MGLYKEKGVNPASGCVPMLLTLPVLFAFYSLLSQSIELRGADFGWWIKDLSEHDPLYITPVLMGMTMFWQQKMTPSTADPAQQRIMMMMPLMFGSCSCGRPAAWCCTGSSAISSPSASSTSRTGGSDLRQLRPCGRPRSDASRTPARAAPRERRTRTRISDDGRP